MSKILSISAVALRPANVRGETGSRGERLAAEYLEANGYRLVVANFKVPIGRNTRGVAVTGEIDIIAIDEDKLCFVEVKTKTSDEFASPLAAVNLRKQRQITRTARVYRRIFGLSEMPYRFDVVTVLLAANANPKMELTKGFWLESKFRKRAWTGDIY